MYCRNSTLNRNEANIMGKLAYSTEIRFNFENDVLIYFLETWRGGIFSLTAIWKQSHI